MNKKTAQKWKLKKDKQQESPTAISFKSHQVSQSQEQIIIPKQYPQFNKNQQILVIDFGKQKLLVQVAFPNNYGMHQSRIEDKSQISVLKTLLDIEGIQCGSSGMFKGQIRILNQNKIHQHNLEIVEFLIKETYFSRRDQYKVMKALKQSLTHVYLRKTLYFDQIAIQVHSMMRNNQCFVKTGIIDKNTKIIFRTNCSKLTVGIELSIQSFQLNENKQLYLQKMIQFLYVFLHRNNYFNNSHRLTLIFYARCFYPKFKTLRQAYDYLIKQNTTISQQQKFQINFSVALQKDFRGRIYQDVYRRIIWSSDMIDNFRQFFWQKISQFLFTINWQTSDTFNHIGKFITKSLREKINDTNQEQGLNIDDFQRSNLKIKPFLHKMKSTLSYSKDSNIFQAISLISQQYRHHYKFRSLNQTGNNIMFLSAGNSQYQVDELSYKMAKSYIYLTNVTCSLVNFNKKIEDPLQANIVCLNKKPQFNQQNKKKLQNIDLNCIQKQVYISPMGQDMIYWDNFQLKNMIYPEQIIEMSPQRSQQAKLYHHCQIKSHYELKQSIVLQPKIDYNIKTKSVSFISVHNMNDVCLYIHQKLYDKLKMNRRSSSKIQQKYKIKQLDVFEMDLDKIIINKKTWNFPNTRNEITSHIQSYQRYLDLSKPGTKQQRAKQLEKTNRNIFKTYNELQADHELHKIQTMSSNIQCTDNHEHMRFRKNSQNYSSEVINLYDNVESEKGKINIFQATFRNKNHQYNAGEKNQNKHKKYITHNKQRRKNLYLQSNIHYLMPQFNEQTIKKFKAFIKKQYIEEFKDEEQRIIALFQMEKTWKNLCFPLLTPIYTRYKQNFQRPQAHLDQGVIDENNGKKNSILDDQISKLLMKNYQIQQSYNQYHHYSSTTVMSKGQISCHLKMIDNNLSRSHIIDLQRQEKIIPFMLYRYLCYEDKDCRFCAKYVYFQDKNYYNVTKRKDLETKTVKIVLAYEDGGRSRQSELMNTFSGFITEHKKQQNLSGSFSLTVKKQRDPFQDFIREFNKKYKQFNVELIGKNNPLQIPKKKKITINFSRKQQRLLYHHQQIEVQINLQYNYSSLFEILVSWNLCSSVIVNDFVETINTMARRSKLKPFLVTAGNIFNTIWSITTIGEIIFQHRISLQLLEQNILQNKQWLWDSNDYFLHISGISFIQFKKDRKLILWRDNNNAKRNIDIKKDDSSKQYNRFFMKSAVFDFIGGLINRVIDDAQIIGKISKNLKLDKQ